MSTMTAGQFLFEHDIDLFNDFLDTMDSSENLTMEQAANLFYMNY